MTLAAGTRLGTYEITAAIGAGGMGEVFRARDTKLDRDVAIKVLPSELAQDRERLARFEREAKLLASLNHSNIAHVYGFESSTLPDGSTAHFLAMELVEGEDLSERLKRGAIPVDEAIAIAKHIAEGLEEAHEHGIIHRDLKPANVKVTPDGKVKVLDFGLAKALEGDAGSAKNSQLSHSPTMSRQATEAGMIMGTAAYMSPEQARGKPVDKRADIWSFGVVLFEMLSGTRLFAGETVSDTLASVLKEEVPWGRLPNDVPRAVVQLLKRCLTRDPNSRQRDIGDARLALSEKDDARVDLDATPAMAPPKTSLGKRAVPWAVGFAVGAIVVGGLDRTLLSRPPTEPPRLVSLTYSGTDSQPTASSDGRMVAFASNRDGHSRIWLKQMATGEEVALTAGPSDADPHFSPDGSTLLFLRGAAPPFSLFQVAAVGGTARRVTDGVASSTAWSPDGKRVALTRASVPGGVSNTLVTLGPDGGDERELARVKEFALGNLQWRPDGGTIGALTTLTTNAVARQTIVDFDAGNGARRTLYEPGPDSVVGAWAWTGPKALLVSETASQSGRGGEGKLRRIETGGGSATLISLQEASLALCVAGPGRIVLDALSPTQNLFLSPITPGSSAAPLPLTRGETVDRQPVFSPDGKRVAFSSDREGNTDIWELDLASGGLRRLTTDKADDWDPGYTPDGTQILWSSKRSGNFEIWIAASDGSGARQVTADGVDAENPTMTPDGRWIVYASANPAHNGIWKIHPDGSSATILVKGAVNNPEVSPDSAWVSFADSAARRLRVATLKDGAEVANLDLPSIGAGGGLSGLTIGRTRWIGGSSTLAWVDYDIDKRAARLVAQEIVPGRDTRASRRLLVAGTFDDMPESFGISPDGRQILVSSFRNRSNIRLIEGLPGVTR